MCVGDIYFPVVREHGEAFSEVEQGNMQKWSSDGLTPVQIHKRLQTDRLKKHKYPRRVLFVDELPKNDRGKVDKKELERRERDGEAPAGY